jgi:5-formyltetrahydrofolate cyclo-ligase
MSATPSKAELRATALAKREALSDKQREAAAKALAKRALPIPITAGMVISGYSPIRNEIDPAPLMQKLALQGARLALPTVNARGKSLIFRAWSPGDRLTLGMLGYGAGHYDYTFAHLRKHKPVIGVGLAFSAQEIDGVPALAHDVALDFVLTEKRVFDFRSG